MERIDEYSMSRAQFTPGTISDILSMLNIISIVCLLINRQEGTLVKKVRGVFKQKQN